MTHVAQSPEPLFFSLMICATAMGDIVEFNGRYRDRKQSSLLLYALLVGTAISAALYGGLVMDTINGSGDAGFQRRLLRVSTALAVATLVAGTVAQVRIAVEELKP